MKTYTGVVVTTYQQKMTVQANTPEEAMDLMYEQSNPLGGSAHSEATATIEKLTEVKGESK